MVRFLKTHEPMAQMVLTHERIMHLLMTLEPRVHLLLTHKTITQLLLTQEHIFLYDAVVVDTQTIVQLSVAHDSTAYQLRKSKTGQEERKETWGFTSTETVKAYQGQGSQGVKNWRIEEETRALRPQKPLRLIRDRKVGGSGIGGSQRKRGLYVHRNH